MVLCIETGKDNIPFIQLRDYYFRLGLEELCDDEDSKRAEKEIRETLENEFWVCVSCVFWYHVF